MLFSFSKSRFSIFLYLALASVACNQEDPPREITKGVYGSPAPLWKKGYKLNELGINAIFVRSGAIDPEMMDRARAEGLKVYAEFATLYGKSYVEKHPEAWAINEKGEKVETADWFMGVCPTEPGFKQNRLEELRKLLQKYDLDGIWMDYVHWHAQFEDSDPILPETCFCDNCLTAFRDVSGIDILEGDITDKAGWILKEHDAAWRTWRCEVIAGWAKDFKTLLKEERSEALLGLYHCPWDDDEFNGARRRILGLDYNLLKNYIDVFSPMPYHERMGRKPEWIAENTLWFSEKLDIKPEDSTKIWPIVQAYQVPAEELEIVLKGGLSGAATGVMMFTSNAMAEDEAKIEVMKSLYQGLK